MPSAASKHFPKVARMKAEMAITYANSRRNSYAHKYTTQLNTDCLLLRKMLDGHIDVTISETLIQVDNIVDQCIFAEENM